MGAGRQGDDPVADLVKGYKKKIKKVCCCGFWWVFLGVGLFVSGIALLIVYGSHIGTEDVTERNLAYTGIALLLISLVMVAIGVVCCVALYTMYKRLDKSDFAKSQFRPPKYGPDDAPYPQQPRSAPCFAEYSPLNKSPADGSPPANPSAPPPVGFKEVGDGDIHVDIQEHTRF